MLFNAEKKPLLSVSVPFSFSVFRFLFSFSMRRFVCFSAGPLVSTVDPFQAREFFDLRGCRDNGQDQDDEFREANVTAAILVDVFHEEVHLHAYTGV